MEHNPWGQESSSGSNGRRSRFSWKAMVAFGWVLFLLLLCVFVFWQKVFNEGANVGLNPDIPTVSTEIPLPELSDSDQLGLTTKRTIEVNGQLKVNSSLVITPADPPDDPVKGQLYYDESTNAPMYYDGQKFIAVANQDDVAVLQSANRPSSVVVRQTINNTTVSVVNSPGPSNLQLENNGFATTIIASTLTANRSITFADASGTVCLQGASSCGFVAGTAANFIQNQDSGAQAGSAYWVGGVGRADGGLIAPSIDVAGGGVLSIGGDASAVAINDDTIINGALDVAVNSASVNSPLLQLTQNGSGDSTIELQNASGSSFYLGMDQSAGGVLRIGSSTAARTTNSIGSTSAGASAFLGVESQIIAKKLVTGPADAGTLASISVHLSAVDGSAPGVKVGVYSHDAANNRPGTLLAATSTSTLGSVGWNAIPLSAPISNNTTYWIAVNIEGSGTGLDFNYCGGCAGESTSTYPRAFNSAWPDVHGPPNNFMDSYEWSMYMDVASGSVNDTYAGAKLFSMTTSGALTLQNSIDTTSAFVIQNAAGVDVVNLDTISGTLSVQDVTLASGKSLLIMGGATGTRPAAPTEGMVYYDTSTKQLLTYANGKWQADRSDAVLVAASNSSNADKDAADYVADGNTGSADDGDQIQINNALTAGAGKKVVLLAGTYTVDNIVSIPNNTTLAGVGQGSLITLPDGFDSNISIIYNQDSTTGDGVVVQDLRIDGNATNQASGNMVGMTLEDLGGGTRQGARVANVAVSNMTGNGVALQDTNKTTVTGVTSTSNGGNGIALINSSGNVISANVGSSNSYSGIGLNGSSSNTIGDNVTQSNAGNGILLAAASNTNTVNGNTAQSNSDAGIHLNGSSHSTITGNTVASNSFSGITVQSNSTANLVSANKIHDNGSSTQNNGIFLWDADSNQITGNSITDSSATNNNYAIHIYDATVDASYVSSNSLGGGSINNLGTATIMGGQVDVSGNYSVQSAGSIELLKNTNVTGTLTVGGALQINGISEIAVNDTTAFVVQNTSDVELLRADTDLMKLTVRELDVTYNLTVGGNVTVGGHIRTSGTSPTTVTGPAACTSPTVSVGGTDTAGMVTVVAGTGCASSGAVMTVVFANAFDMAPKVTLTPATSATTTLPAYVDYDQVTTASFDITTTAALADGATYRWYYHAIE